MNTKQIKKGDRLKPCPFCGGENLDFSLKIATRGYNKESMYHGVIYCKDCHAYGTRVLCYSSQQYRYSEEEKEMFYQQAVKAWNTRRPDLDINDE